MRGQRPRTRGAVPLASSAASQVSGHHAAGKCPTCPAHLAACLMHLEVLGHHSHWVPLPRFRPLHQDPSVRNAHGRGPQEAPPWCSRSSGHRRMEMKLALHSAVSVGGWASVPQSILQVGGGRAMAKKWATHFPETSAKFLELPGRPAASA